MALAQPNDCWPVPIGPLLVATVPLAAATSTRWRSNQPRFSTDHLLKLVDSDTRPGRRLRRPRHTPPWPAPSTTVWHSTFARSDRARPNRIRGRLC